MKTPSPGLPLSGTAGEVEVQGEAISAWPQDMLVTESVWLDPGGAAAVLLIVG